MSDYEVTLVNDNSKLLAPRLPLPFIIVDGTQP